jgi:hypothetical protein
MNWKSQIAYNAVATLVRIISTTVLVAQLLTIAVTMGPAGWARWRRLDLSWRFWMGVGDWCAALAGICLIVCLLLAILRPCSDKGELKNTRWCVWINIITIGLLFFVPAIAAI